MGYGISLLTSENEILTFQCKNHLKGSLEEKPIYKVKRRWVGRCLSSVVLADACRVSLRFSTLGPEDNFLINSHSTPFTSIVLRNGEGSEMRKTSHTMKLG